MLAPVALVAVVAVSVGFLSAAQLAEPFAFAIPFGELAVNMSVAGLPLASALRRRVGRPRKFDAPSRAVTLTLPESVIKTLAGLNSDLSRAVVALTLTKNRAPRDSRQPAEIEVFGKRGIISVSPTPALEHRTGMELVPMRDGRALITLDSTKTISDLELKLHDALADPDLPEGERGVFKGIVEILQEARRSSDVSLLRRSIIVLESAGRARKRSAQSGRR